MTIVDGYDHLDQIKQLWRDYIIEIGIDLGFQDFEQEMASLPGKYARPHGRLLVAIIDQQVVGCIGLRQLFDQSGEIKRLYIKPSYRNQKIAKQLVSAIIEHAKSMNMDTLFLDTLINMHQARQLYQGFGFKECESYYDSPLTNAVYYRLTLNKKP